MRKAGGEPKVTPRDSVALARPGHPTGVGERGMHTLGPPGNLGGPAVSVETNHRRCGEPVDQRPQIHRRRAPGSSTAKHRMLWRYRAATKKWRETDGGESERLHSTGEVGELGREDPMEGRRASDRGTVGGKD